MMEVEEPETVQHLFVCQGTVNQIQTFSSSLLIKHKTARQQSEY